MYVPISPLPDTLWPFKRSKSVKPPRIQAAFGFGARQRMRLYPRGAHALAAAAGIAGGSKRLVCFVPAYFCNQSLFALRRTGARLVFYRLTENYNPDWDDVQVKAARRKPDLFVLVHYFGVINDVAAALTFVRAAGAILLEDAAHVLQPVSGMAPDEAIQMYSPHKLLPIPPIAFLSIPQQLWGHNPGQQCTCRRLEDIVWSVKRHIQKMFALMSWPPVWMSKTSYRRMLAPSTHSCNDSLPDQGGNPPSEISHMGLLGMQRHIKDLETIADRRIANYRYLVQRLMEAGKELIKLPWVKFPAGQVPYLLPLRLSPHRFERTMAALHRWHIPAHRWPDLPPEVLAEPSKYPTSLELYKTQMFLPVHQSLTQKALRYTADRLVSFLERTA